jgi:hypothetical protein
LIIEWSSKVEGPSVVIAWPLITTSAAIPCFLAKSAVQTMAAAAPHVGGQHWKRVSGPNTCGEPSTSSTLSWSLKMA